MIRWRHMQYLIRLSDLLQAFQDQENIIVPLMFTRGKKLFERNNPLECCHEIRIGKQNVHANKVYAGMERQKICSPACKLSDLQVSGLPCPSL